MLQQSTINIGPLRTFPRRFTWAACALLLFGASFLGMGYFYWLDDDSGNWDRDSICRDHRIMAIKPGMSKDQVRRRFPGAEGYRIRCRFINRGRRETSPTDAEETTVEEWSIRKEQYGESIITFFDAKERVIRKDCGNA